MMLSKSARNIFRFISSYSCQNSLAAKFLFAYLIIYLLVPYKPWTMPVSLHTPVMLFGTALLLIELWHRHRTERLNFSLSSNMQLFIAVILTFLFSALAIHADTFSRQGFQAYLFSFLCFLFVCCAVGRLKINLLYTFFNVYLIINGILLILQTYFGHPFYPCNFLGDYVFYYYPSCGFANDPTLGGGIIVWPLSIIAAKYSAMSGEINKNRRKVIELFAIGMGFIALFYTFSRAAWLGMICALLGIGVFLVILKRPKTHFCHILAIIFIFAIIPSLPRSPIDALKQKTLTFFTKLPPLKPKIDIHGDVSINTRLHAYIVALSEIRNSPLWGIGIDQFPKYYSDYVHKLSPSERNSITPNYKITTHNSYLYYAVETGLLPFTVLFLFISQVLFMGIKKGVNSQTFPFLIGFIAICIWIIFNDFIQQRIFWIACAMAAGLANVPRREKN